MKVLSIHQPWAWAIVHLGKVENRSWETTYRGPVLIHACKSLSREAYQERAAYIREISGAIVPPLEALDLGGVIGTANLVACFWRGYGSPKIDRPKSETRWHEPECFGLYFENARPLRFRPCKGHQGRLFDASFLR